MSRQTALGVALRAWRGRVSPAAAGVPDWGDRRVPGLRRDELATLAQVSVDYVTRLEQGRATRPSTQVLGALASALRLSAGERRVFYTLAGAVAPGRGDVPVVVPGHASALLERWVDAPLAVCSPAWELLRWNAMWASVAGDPEDWSARERNLAWRYFMGSDGRLQLDDDSRGCMERELIAVLRTAQLNYPRDRDLIDLITTLSRASALFAAAWSRFEVTARGHHRKTILHPQVGMMTMDCAVVTITGSDLLMLALTAERGSVVAKKLEVLRSGGGPDLQTMSDPSCAQRDARSTSAAGGAR